MKGHGAGKLTLAIALTIAFGPTAIAQQSPAQELLRQQERERALQEQQDPTPGSDDESPMNRLSASLMSSAVRLRLRLLWSRLQPISSASLTTSSSCSR
jgi:hypothetical protein